MSSILKQKNPHILIIEKDLSIREDITLVLSSHGCLVTGYSGIEKAHQYLDNSLVQPDLIIISEILSTVLDKKHTPKPTIIFGTKINMEELIYEVEHLLI